MLAKSCVLAVLAASALGSVVPLQRAPAVQPAPVLIDGINNTVGLTLDGFFHGNITEIFEEIIEWIAKAIDPPPTADIDYFKVIALNVRNVVGEYVNEHNMDQILHYKGDLADLITRYAKCPNSSTIYADKNTCANSFHTNMQANRFLIEAVEFPDSMMLHYADIASLDIAVLRDAALTYTTTTSTSYWWVDLDDQLEHYISFGTNLTTTLVTWRNDMVDCDVKKCEWLGAAGPELQCYDVYTIHDKVSGIQDICKAVHGVDHSCDDACDKYKVEMNKTVQDFIEHYLGKVMDGWKDMKKVSEVMAEKAKHGH